MKLFSRLTILFGVICTLSACSGLQKKVAIDDLVGIYKGKPTFVYQWSKLNIGMEDQQEDSEETESLIIRKDSKGNLLLKFDDGLTINMNNIQLAQNGAAFNIPKQDFNYEAEGMVLTGSVVGLSENMFGESKCDGFYDSDLNKLSFSFAGTIILTEDGQQYSVPIGVGYYDFVKEK